MRLCPQCNEPVALSQSICAGCGSAVSSLDNVDADTLLGLKVGGRYVLEELLGKGAMGWIYRGVHTDLESSVAVKLMKPHLRADESWVERFRREAKAASRLNHPHIVSVIDFGETGSGLLFMITEFVRGESLAAVVDRHGAMAPMRALRITCQILDALEESHAGGVVHRDMKTENIMLTVLRDGQDFIKVLDFGIAKPLDDKAPRLSLDGQVFGTPDYMAPEQIRSEQVTPATDLYAAGVVLYELLTARLPYAADNIFEVMKDHLYAPIPRLVDHGVDPVWSHLLQPVIERALAKDPKMRFAKADQFRKALDAVAADVGPASVGPPVAKQAAPAVTTRAPSFRKKADFKLETGETAQSEAVDPVDVFADPGGGGGAGAVSDTGATSGRAEAKPFGAFAKSVHGSTEDVVWSRKKTHPAPTLPHIERPTVRETVERLLDPKGDVNGVAVVGDVGTGKSYTARWTRRQAAEQGYRVVWVDAQSLGIPASWSAIKTAVERILDLKPRPQADDLAGAVKRHPALEPELAGLLALYGQPGPLADAERNVRECECLSALVRVLFLATQQPLLVVFEDADRYDRVSRLALLRLAHRSAECPHRVLITAQVPVFNLPESWREVRLKRLLRDEFRAVAQTMKSVSSTTLGQVRRYFTLGAQSPFLLQQAMRAAHETRGQDRPPGTDSPFDLVAFRVGLLPQSPREVLQALAVAGGRASLTQIAAMVDRKSLDRSDVAKLQHRGFVRLAEGGSTARAGDRTEMGAANATHAEANPLAATPAKIDSPATGHVEANLFDAVFLHIAHPIIGEVVRRSVPAARRQALHLKWLALTRQIAPSTVLAHHAEAAKAYRRALDHYLAAARKAETSLDAYGAAALYKKARDVLRWKLLEDETSERYVTIAVHLARNLLAYGNTTAAELLYKSVQKDARGNPHLDSLVAMGLADILMLEHRSERAGEVLTAAVGRVLPSGETDVLTELYLALGNLLLQTGERRRALGELKEGLDMITMGEGMDAKSVPPSVWKLLLRLADIQFQVASETAGKHPGKTAGKHPGKTAGKYPGKTAEQARETGLHKALSWAGGALGQAKRLRSPLGRARAHQLIARISAALGNTHEQRVATEQALAALKEIGDRRGQAYCLLDMARIGPKEPELYRQAAFAVGDEVKWCKEIEPKHPHPTPTPTPTPTPNPTSTPTSPPTPTPTPTPHHPRHL